MAHEVESMFSSNRVVPWHGLGNVLPGYPESREEVLTAAGLDWQVGEFPVTVELPDGTKIEAADKKGHRPADRQLAAVDHGAGLHADSALRADRLRPGSAGR